MQTSVQVQDDAGVDGENRLQAVALGVGQETSRCLGSRLGDRCRLGWQLGTWKRCQSVKVVPPVASLPVVE